MRLPEFTAEASLGKISEHYVFTSGYMGGASTGSLQLQFKLHPDGDCTIARIECFIFNNCYLYNKYCVPSSPLGGGGGGSNAGPAPGPGSTTVFSGVS
jgi:hypothetical protein